ncbi:MAG: DNA polymerase III subunit beta [Rhodothermales bacterium]|nr:DNA polymerase III subunit beta [Rhodothermales bacterium]MBO6778792.1 DNA polymerase III subunit beta [Rhodothermales bacterium]
MRFTASSTELLRSLQTVNGAVPSKSTLPILECILFEQDGSALRLSATDLEISIRQKLDLKVENAGSEGPNRVAVPAKRLIDTLRALSDVPVAFEADGDFNVTLATEQGRYKMVGFDGADYPALPELTESDRIETTGTLLKRAIQKTGFAVSKDALRPAMMGIFFQIGGDGGKAVATDGHRLVKLSLEEMTSASDIQFVVPEKAMSLAAKVAGDGDCTVSVDGGYVAFDFDRSRVLARLIDEPYPNYQAVIPVDNEKQLTVSREAMLAAVRRVALYSSSMTNQIRLAIGSDSVKISAEDIERASEAHETVQSEFQGEEMVIGFNAVYLTEVLSNIDADEVLFEFSSPNRAGVVTPLEQKDGESMMMLIMPVMLNTYA